MKLVDGILNGFCSSLRLDAEYYIRKQIIPPLSRVFNLVGVGKYSLTIGLQYD